MQQFFCSFDTEMIEENLFMKLTRSHKYSEGQ